MQIASYWAGLSFRIDRKEIRKVDTHLKQIEDKLKKFNKKLTKSFSLQISKFDIDDKKLNIALGNALDRASDKVVLEIKRFDIDRMALQRAMNTSGVSGPAGRGFGNTFINNRVLGSAEWDRREAAKQNSWWERRNALREDEARRAAERSGGPQRPGNSSFRGGDRTTMFGAGGVAGLASRAYLPIIAGASPFFLAGMASKANEQVVAAKLQTQAVTQAYGGTKELGNENFEWLKGQANRVGFSWIDAAPDFNVLMSNLLGSGGTNEDARTVFKGFAEYGRVNKLSDARQQLVFNALGQVAGKDKLQAEELTKQLGNSLPGAKSIFAEAWQRKTGGRLTGGEAIIALEAAMGDGLVRGDILTYAAQVASEKAAPGLSAASQAAQAERNRFKNARMQGAEWASEAGLETGFGRLWRSFTAALLESKPAIESMARAFDEISKYISFATLLPQSIKRAFEGRDSWVADMIGQSNVDMIRSFMDGMKDLGKEIKTTLGFAVDGWKMIFDEFGDEMLSFINGIKNVLLYTFKALNSFLAGDLKGGTNSLGAVRATLAGQSQTDIEAVASGKAGIPSLTETFMGDKAAWQYTPPAMMFDFMSGLYAGGWDKFKSTEFSQTFSKSADQYQQQKMNYVNASGGTNVLPGINTPTQTTVEVKMDVNISAANPEDFNEKFKEKFKDVLTETMLQYSQKE